MINELIGEVMFVEVVRSGFRAHFIGAHNTGFDGSSVKLTRNPSLPDDSRDFVMMPLTDPFYALNTDAAFNTVRPLANPHETATPACGCHIADQARGGACG